MNASVSLESEIAREILRDKGRRLRVFSPDLELVWEGGSVPEGFRALFHNDSGEPTPIPPPGNERDEWPVWVVLQNGKAAERYYWFEASPGQGLSDCYHVRAWPMAGNLADERSPIIEEAEQFHWEAACASRLEPLEVELRRLLWGVTNLIAEGNESPRVRLRLSSPVLARCYEVKNCQRTDCTVRAPHFEGHCWEAETAVCCEGVTFSSPIEKFLHCARCEVFAKACPNPLARISEDINTLLSLLEMKHEEGLAVHDRIQQMDKIAAIGELVLGIAHEVKTPLSIIMGRLDCLRWETDSLTPETVRKDMEVIASHCRRMRQVLDSLMAMAGPKPFHRAPVDLNEEIYKVLAMTRKTLKKGNVRIALKLSKNLPTIEGDSTSLEQVLLNLILNARDAMPEGGELRLTTLCEAGPPPAVVVRIADNGEGIAPTDQERIFSMFYTSKAARGGSGLGLAVCRRIIGRHGGAISVSSSPGQGAEFRLNFPLPG